MSIRISNTKAFLIVFIPALIVRLSIIVGYAFGFFNGSLSGSDSKLYFTIAHNLIGGNGFATEHGPTAFVSPLFPMFIAACLSVFGENPIFISLVQSVLSSLVCVFICFYTTKIFGDTRIGLVAGLIAAIHFELILWSNAQLLTEPLYVFFFALALLLLIYGLTHKNLSFRFFALSGFAFGLASLTRPISIGIAIGLALILCISAVAIKNVHWKNPVIFLGVFLLVMFPWGLRNYLVMGSFTISSLEGGHVLWLGNNPEYDKFEHPDLTKFGGYTTMFAWDDEMAERFRGKTEAESNAIFTEAAGRHILDNPGAFLKRAAHKNWNMWRPNFAGSSGRNNLVSFTFYPLMLILALLGILLAWLRLEGNFFRKIAHPVAILIAVFLMHILIHSVITGEIRFRVPIWLVLIPFSAFSFVTLLERFLPSAVTVEKG